ncbi:SH3 domain-containing protein [Paeniglutamicibacter sulfureus]|uniref:Uncharacterized protein YgiM (DUF1202 family) n=2 Tax=Paeniglutamicibacter sulfureus TaxID=43666 RepID=A0ABU2BP03_9MICC|nr:SH3 domain-containing protein [Paeniglutamicibacter sulfureus]MDR7360360.1 uncharacterized protein YgiM (DUF1202 family) [Paeniglutamicibacter sulfureus]
MQSKYLGVVLALAVALIGGPTTVATAQPLAPTAAVSISTAKVKAVKQTTANLNLRKNATVKSASLVLIPKNTKLTILRVSGTWHQVTFKSKTGWVSGDYLTSVSVAKSKVYNYTKVFTAVKAKASGSSASVLSLHRQTKVEVLGRSGSWTRIIFSGKAGFVPASSLGTSNPSNVYRWVKGKQPVYQAARTSGKRIGTLSNNTRIQWLRTSGSWQQVRTGAGIGWIQSSKLSTAAIKPPAKVYNYTKVFTTVKAKASGSSASVLSLHRQTQVEVLGRSGSWTRVLAAGKAGFVPASSLGTSNPSNVYRWVKGKQPVYQAARTSGKRIGTLSNNTRIQWLRTSGSWQQVRTGAGIGWIQSSKLSTAAIKPPAKVYNYTKVFTTVKAKASSSSASVLSLHRQTQVEVLGRSGSWTRVLAAGKAGFVPASSLGTSNPSNVYRWVKGKQPVYQAAKSSGKRIGTLSNNTRIQWLRTSGSWQQVRTGAGIGWIQSSKLSTTAIKVIPPTTTVTFSTPRWTTANLNLRSGAGTGYGSVAVVPKGERVLLGRSSGGWANVKTSKGTGWISAGYLSTVAPKPPVVKPNPPKPDLVTFSAPRWTTANLNLRSGAGTRYGSVAVVPKGERVLLGRSSGGWANVKTSKGTGWVSVIYLSTVAPPPPVTTQYRWAAGNVNLRAGNSTVYPIMGLVPAGERVTYLQSKSGWARVVTSRGTGWMSEDYLSTKAVATLQPDTIAVNAAVKQRYAGYVSAYGGVRAGSVGHSSGVATDLMIKDYKSAQGIRNGDEIARFLIANRDSLGIYYLIWKDKIWLGPAKGWEEYSKSGKYGNQFVNNWNDTTRHLDHIHAETYGNSGTGAPLVK